MRRWHRGEWGVVKGDGHLPRKKSFVFVPKMISLGAFCRSF